MKTYAYKLQWLAPLKKATKLINVIGARSLSKLCARDRTTLNVVATYSNIWNHTGTTANLKTNQWMRQQYKLNKDLDFELIRK